jgi:hypothetical protein
LGGLTVALFLVVAASHIPGGSTPAARLRHYVGAAAFFGLLLVPTSSQSFLVALPPWAAGLAAIGYVAYYLFPQESPAPVVGSAGHVPWGAALLRIAPLIALVVAAIAAPRILGALLPPTVSQSWEVSAVLPTFLVAAWLLAAGMTVSRGLHLLRRPSHPAPRSSPTPSDST